MIMLFILLYFTAFLLKPSEVPQTVVLYYYLFKVLSDLKICHKPAMPRKRVKKNELMIDV